MDELAFDPFVIGALVTYLVAAGGLGALVTAARVLGRGAAWEQLGRALAQAKQLGAATFAPLAGGRHGEFLVLAKGRHMTRLPGGKELAPITRAALVKDKDGQTGLVLEAGGQTSCVTGLEPMTRAWSQLQQDEVPVELVFRDDEPACSSHTRSWWPTADASTCRRASPRGRPSSCHSRVREAATTVGRSPGAPIPARGRPVANGPSRSVLATHAARGGVRASSPAPATSG